MTTPSIPHGTCGAEARAGGLMSKGMFLGRTLNPKWLPVDFCRFEPTFFLCEWVNARWLWITLATLRVAWSIRSQLTYGLCKLAPSLTFQQFWLVTPRWTGFMFRLLLGSTTMTPSTRGKYQDISLKTRFKLLSEDSAPLCCHWIPNKFLLALTLQTYGLLKRVIVWLTSSPA